jgi:glycerophosphoryl diester phosphodiesterase
MLRCLPWFAMFVLGCSANAEPGAPEALEPPAGEPSQASPLAAAGSPAPAPMSPPIAPCRPPLLFGHRGTPLSRPENTLPAFQFAIDAGGDGLEIDINLSADGEVVVIHDTTTGRTTDDGEDRAIADLTLAQIKQLDAGAWFDPAYAGTRIPTLREVVVAFPDPKILLLLDMKGEGIGPATVAAIRELGIADRALMSSFDEALLAQVHADLPEVPIVYYLSTMDEVSRAPEVGATYLRVPSDIEEEDPANVQAVIDAGYLPAVSGHLVQWNGGIGLVNSMPATAQRRTERRPAHCE